MNVLTQILSLLFIILFSSSLVTGQDSPLKNLDEALERILEETKAAGFSVAVVDRNEIIYEKGFGYRDYENKIPADENTLYAIGSSTKAFTSSLLGMQRDEGNLSFEDSPRDYIKGLKFYNNELNSLLTIEDFMCHRSGIPRHDFSWYLFPTSSRDSLIRRMEFQEPFTGVRENWYYNNFGFLIQGMVSESLTGKTWEENIHEQIFDRLGMTRSNCTIESMSADDNAAKGYNLRQDSIIEYTDYYNIGSMGPAGSINSSVHEMANWVKTWIHGGSYNGEQIFSEAYANDAITAQMVIGGGTPGADNPDLHMSTYGYGWMMMSYRGHYRVEHGGNIDGFSASVSFFPSDSIGIIVLANQSGSAAPYLVRNTIADLWFGIDSPEWLDDFVTARDERIAAAAEAEESRTSNKVEGTSPSHALIEFEGDYSHDGYGVMRLFVEDEMMLGTTSLGDTFAFQHFHYNVFDVMNYEDGEVDTNNVIELKLNFRVNNAGEISGFEAPFEQALDPIFFDREPAVVDIDTDLLNSYVGEYELSGMVAKVYIKGENTLYVFVPGQPEYELLSLGDNMFAFKILDGFKVEFLEDENGAINAMNFIQPNGTFKATRKE